MNKKYCILYVPGRWDKISILERTETLDIFEAVANFEDYEEVKPMVFETEVPEMKNVAFVTPSSENDRFYTDHCSNLYECVALRNLIYFLEGDDSENAAGTSLEQFETGKELDAFVHGYTLGLGWMSEETPWTT